MSQKDVPSLDDLGIAPSTKEAPAKKPAPKKTTAKKTALEPPAPNDPNDGEKFSWVLIPEKSKETDLDYVPVGVNGEMLQLQRGSKIILPERFLKALDNAQTPVYKKDPEGGDRKITAMVQKVSYTVLSPATREEFLEMKTAGRLSKK